MRRRERAFRSRPHSYTMRRLVWFQHMMWHLTGAYISVTPRRFTQQSHHAGFMVNPSLWTCAALMFQWNIISICTRTGGALDSAHPTRSYEFFFPCFEPSVTKGVTQQSDMLVTLVPRSQPRTIPQCLCSSPPPCSATALIGKLSSKMGTHSTATHHPGCRKCQPDFLLKFLGYRRRTSSFLTIICAVFLL